MNRCRRQQIFERQDKKDDQGSDHDTNLNSTPNEYEHPLESGGYQELGVFNQMSVYDNLEWYIGYNCQIKNSIMHE